MNQAAAPKKVIHAEHLAHVSDMAPPPDPWNTRDATSLFAAPLPPVAWVCPELDMAPGRPTGVFSKPGEGKTTEMLDVCCAVATGTKAFQRFECRRGKVAFITYDMGFIPTATKLRQIANGRGHSFEELNGQIEILTFPSIYLNTANAEELFRERFHGYLLVVIDCFRDAIPGVKENESETGGYLKSLARISEQDGSTFAYLHHSQKGEAVDALDVGRGSGAIRGASGAIWVMNGSGSSPRLFTHSRTHDCSLGPKEPFLVELMSLPAGGAFETTHPSILLTARSLKEAKGEAFMAQVEANKAAGRERLQTLLALLRSHPNCSRNDLRQHTRGTVLGSKDTLRDAINDAIEQGLVTENEVTGRGGARKVLNLSTGSGA